MRKPLCFDIYCGLGGWSSGFLAEGWDCVGFDIERHVYGQHQYPGQLVIQDALTIHGSQLKDADCLVASPPCQRFSYMAMPWSLAKAKARDIRADETGAARKELTKLFDACFRIQREAGEAAGRKIPLIVENVKGAQPWVGRARWAFGSFFLWGDVPALMPIQKYHRRLKVSSGEQWNTSRPNFTGTLGWDDGVKNTGGSWFNIGSPGQKVTNQNPVHDGIKGIPHRTAGHWTNPAEHGLKQPGINLSDVGFNVANARQFRNMVEGVKIERSAEDKRQHLGSSRKFASAMIAKIPEPLSRHIARVYLP